MCGILYARLKNTALQTERTRVVFANALALVKYRGPDATGITAYENHLFGHVRLAIIDPSATANQPLENESGILIFNGELYNYADLDPSASSDTHVLFNTFAKFSERLPEIRGMYAAIYLDKTTNQVHFIRDYYGEKPLYIFENKDIHIACSSLKPIRYLLGELLGISLTASSSAIEDYLLFGYVREPLSIYENVTAFPNNSHQITTPTGDSTINKLIPEPPILNSGYLDKSITATDVTPVLLLSSGVDSTYLLSRIQRGKLATEVAVYAHQNPAIDESRQALKNLQLIAPAATAHEIKNTFQLTEIHRLHAALMEQPSIDGLDMLNVLSGLKVQRPATRLVLTGTGGDELHGGYNSFHRLKFRGWLKFFSRLTGGRIRALSRFGLSLPQEEKYPVAAYYFKYRLDENFLPFLPDQSVGERFRSFIDHHTKAVGSGYNTSSSTWNNQEKQLYALKQLEVTDYLKNQLLRDTDNIAMYLGIEARNPLLSPEAMRTIPDFKVAMSEAVAKRHQVSFGPKQGFNYGEDQAAFIALCRQELPQLLSQFPDFKEMTNSLLEQKVVPYASIKKIYMLLRWMEVNDVTS